MPRFKTVALCVGEGSVQYGKPGNGHTWVYVLCWMDPRPRGCSLRSASFDANIKQADGAGNVSSH